MSDMKQALEGRLESLGITKYELAKRIAEKKDAKPTSVSNLVGRTFESPESRTYGNLLDIIEAMGGTVVIRWTNIEETVAS